MFNELFESIKKQLNEDYKRDSRYSPMVQQNYDEGKRDVKRYLNGYLSSLAEVKGDEYSVVVLDNNCVLFIHQDMQDKPAPSGEWMDWWEEDLEKYFNVSKDEYKNLSREERAELEAKLQLKLWVDIEFWNLYAEYYFPEEYDIWWWDEGGKELGLKGLSKTNDYWKAQFKK